MHITKVELEDIKSHTDSKFGFERGTTAIMGENGAGKTTLIEAVAWTLFDLLDYKKDDFVKRGAKKGVARVTFESGMDERRYVVHRDTKTAYYVYDPKLKMRIADKKEEVTRFLWKHLGVETGTDLESLFRRAIGVPQGTFTAIFLESPTERKRAFDKLLKVEEYRESSDKLRETSKYIDSKIIKTSEGIARAEGELKRYEEYESELKETAKTRKKIEKSAAKMERVVAEKRKIIDEFEKIEAKVSELTETIKTLENKKSRARLVLKQKESEMAAAEQASEAVKTVEEDYKKHIKALGMLKEFERERREREKLNKAKADIEAAIVKIKSDLKTTKDERKRVARAHSEIEGLKPKVKAQDDVEKRREEVRNQKSEAATAKSRLESIGKKLEKLRDRYRENQTQKKETEKAASEAKHLKTRQKQDDSLRRKIAALNAVLERDRKFQSEIKNGLCPLLTEKCLNLKEGQTLEDFASTKFTEIKAEIEKLESDQKELKDLLETSREADKQLAQLETLKKREEEIAKDGVSLKEEKEALEKKAGSLEKLGRDLEDIERQLKALNNPRARIQILEKETAKEISLREQLTNIESNLERLESDRRLKVEQLEMYKDLDSNWKEYSAIRDKTAHSHREFIKNEASAKSLPEKSKEVEAEKTKLEETQKSLTKAERDLKRESEGFEIEKYSEEKKAFRALEKELFEIQLDQKHSKKRETELEAEIKSLKKTAEALKIEVAEKERLERIRGVTSFIRSTLKEAAPRVARNYVYHVSIEANQMFREITGNAERTLKWADDYGILLEENGFERPFQNLSGGEQMAAAMSVRLALLRQLSDLRIAFFDEPTMNMDAAHRQRLAEQISEISENQTFDQLFVISHDDTFESYADNVVTVSPEQAETAASLF